MAKRKVERNYTKDTPKMQKDSPKKQKKISEKTKKKEEKDSNPDKKIIKTTVVGHVPVDIHFPDNNYHVYMDKLNEFNGKYFAVTLNKTSLDKNSNKFFIIQLLEPTIVKNTPSPYVLYTRWGRVGERGVDLIKNFDLEEAVKEFKKKYRDKTRGGYKEIFIDYGEYETQESKKNTPTKKSKEKKMTLDKNLIDFLELIYNKDLMQNQMREIGYDAKKMPLGKLANQTLDEGLKILKEIEKELKNKDISVLSKLSSEFYTIIPHNVGFQKMKNFIIDTQDKINDKIAMIDSLRDMKIATKIIDNTQSKNDYEDLYEKLNCKLRTISKEEEIYDILNTYLTAKITNDNYYHHKSLTLIDAFEVERKGEKEKFKDFGNKMLLWHGTRITNCVGILSQGLRIAPPEAPSNGYLFGKGIYLADHVQKSCHYCYPVNRHAIILLCEASLGKEDKRYCTDHMLPKTLKKECHSIHGVGNIIPKDGFRIGEKNDVFVPNGDSEKENIKSYSNYSEYIVYNVDQVKIKYVLRIRFDN